MLSVEQVTVRFGATTALDRVDVRVDRGETVSVLGPSGCGKSTLLRVVAGLEPSSGGRVVLDGRDLDRVPPHRRAVGLMFQDYALFPHRDVAANVAFGLRMRGDLAAADIRRRTGEALEQVGLAGFERRAVNRLSGGEAQRVALARALAPEPSVLMLDEPLGSLDRGLRDRLLVELGALFTRLDVTVLYVTHDQSEAFALADRVVLLRAGRVVQEGTPTDVWARPADEEAARFLGLVNVVDGRVAEGVVHGPWGTIPVASSTGPGAVRLVVRPDALVPSDGGPVTGAVTGRSFRGDHFLVTVTTDAGPSLEVALRGAAVPAVGERASFAIDPAGVVVLSR